MRRASPTLFTPRPHLAVARPLTTVQCRERWHNQLDPNIKRGPWTLEEDQLLLRAHSEHGSKWSLIAKCLPGRTDNSIKNRWNSALRRELRKMNRAAEDAELGRTPVDEPELVAPALAAPGLASAAPGGEGAGSAPGGLLPLPFAAAPLAVDGPTGACQPLAGDAAPTPTTPTAQPLPTAPLAPHGADAPLIGAAHDNASTAQRALRSELAALRESSSDDATKRLLRAQLVEQLRQLNATWENTGVAPSANHIQVRAAGGRARRVARVAVCCVRVSRPPSACCAVRHARAVPLRSARVPPPPPHGHHAGVTRRSWASR